MASHCVKCLLLTSSALQLLPGLVGIRLPPNESSVLPGAFTQMGLLRTLLKGRNSWRNPDQMPRLPQLTPFSKNKKNSFQKTLLTPHSFFFFTLHIFLFLIEREVAVDQEKPLASESLPDGSGSNRTGIMSGEGPHVGRKWLGFFFVLRERGFCLFSCRTNPLRRRALRGPGGLENKLQARGHAAMLLWRGRLAAE